MHASRTILPLMLAGCLAASAYAQQPTGAIDFAARATPAGGVAEPVRGLPFYLLRKSYEEILREATAKVPKPDFDAFVNSLNISPELKGWMKRHRSVALSGEDFIRRLKPEDILGVPEFRNAYVTDNVSARTLDFPMPKFRESDRTRNPTRYRKQVRDYDDALWRFLTTRPQSMEGIDLELTQIDPSSKWARLESERAPEIRRLALEWAHNRYLVAQTTSDLEGRGHFSSLRPGNYWLSTLELDAEIGDTRLRWDAPVMVRAGEVTQVELTNFNAVERPRPSP